MAREDQIEFKVEPFDVQASADPEAHAAVARFVDSVVAMANGSRSTDEDVEQWDVLVRKDAAWNHRCVLALTRQAAHWGEQRRQLLTALGGGFRATSHRRAFDSGYRLHGISRALSALLRRRLPLTQGDLVVLSRTAVELEGSRHHGVPPGGVVKQAEWMAEAGALGADLREVLRELAAAMRSGRFPDPKLAFRLEHLLRADSGDEYEATHLPSAVPPPAPAGSADVLVDLKRRLGLLKDAEVPEVEIEEIGRDRFPLPTNSPLRAEHEAISRVVQDVLGAGRNPGWQTQLNQRVAAEMDGATSEILERMHLAAWERRVDWLMRPGETEGWQVRGAVITVARHIASQRIRGGRDAAFDAALAGSALTYFGDDTHKPLLVESIQEALGDDTATPGERHAMHRLRCRLIDVPPMGALPPNAERLTKLIDGEGVTLLLVPGEHWSDAAHADLAGMKPKARGAWTDLLRHCLTATSAKPSKAWAKQAAGLVKAVGAKAMRERVEAWFPLTGRGKALPMISHADTLNDGNADVLRGLVWAVTPHAEAGTARLIADLLTASIMKVPGVGPRCVKLANACVWSLGEMAAAKEEAVRDAALGQLARLKARVTFRTTLNAIDKALDKAAAEAGVSRETLEELGVPTFGFEGGVRREELGGAVVELRVEGNGVTTTWTNDKGKVVKSPPAAVKREFKDDLKEIKAAASDAEGVLLAGRDRLDNSYLADKAWPLRDWRERWLDHGLLGTLARRLIWSIDGHAVLFEGDTPRDVGGEPVEFADTAQIRLWHPIGHTTDDVLRWRDRLSGLGITQPFKQAHREVYPLTDAERNTGTYSNRFAAHIVRQHQFNALCAARGWRSQLRLMVDDVYGPPRRELPAHALRAEFWVEGVGDQYGTDTTNSGSFLHLATDQVRFYRTGAAPNIAHAAGGRYETHGPGDEADNHPLPLEEVPPLVLSEVLRDCDLFVGVSSVGNDPTWADGGPGGRFREYWAHFSFGDLTRTAQTRKQVLERLVPRLAIADRCTISDKFLAVRGELHTYRIHLGSGNILMEGDRYLCIVPKSSGVGRVEERVQLPFEGDRTLSIILSKAMMLAADTKITDSTILSQIGQPRRGG